MTSAILLALALGAADPCAPVEPAAAADPAAAVAYRKVGDAERAAGSRETATVAYRAALAHDPSDQASRKRLRSLCEQGTSRGDPFGEGVRLMKSGDLAGAVAAFQEARAGGPDPSSALLEGICYYELGEDEQAEPLLREAEAAPAHRDAAHFYLGLMALRAGEASQATTLLDSAAANPGFGAIASDMARLSRRSGKLVLSFLAESRWDSNVILLPSGATPSGQVSDGSAAFTATGLYRPYGEIGPYLRALGLYSQQFQINTFDLGGLSGAVGWQLGRPGRRLLAEYDYDYRTLGGSPYLSAHRLLASGWLAAGDVILSATYFARFESYQSSLFSPFSGIVQNAEAKIMVPIGKSVWLGAGYGAGRDATDQSSYSWIQHGPRAQLRWQLSRSARLGVDASVTFRPYDNVATYNGAQVKRSDTFLDALALVEYDLADRWTARLSVEGLRTFSNVSNFDFFKVVPVLGIAYVMGL